MTPKQKQWIAENREWARQTIFHVLNLDLTGTLMEPVEQNEIKAKNIFNRLYADATAACKKLPPVEVTFEDHEPASKATQQLARVHVMLIRKVIDWVVEHRIALTRSDATDVM